MELPKHVDRISIGLPIFVFKGSQSEIFQIMLKDLFYLCKQCNPCPLPLDPPMADEEKADCFNLKCFLAVLSVSV